MACDYERFIQMGGFSGQIRGARAAELLRKHHHHSVCGGPASGSTAGAGSRLPELRACRVCGAVDCAKPECFRSILIRHRLGEHAAAAERDAGARRNGHGR